MNDDAWEMYRRGKLPHIVAYERPLFVTFNVLNRRTLPPGARTIMLRRLVYGHERWYWLHVGIVMPDHVHLILTITRGGDQNKKLRQIMKGIKGASAYDINCLLGWKGTLWQEDSYDHVVRRDEGLENTIRYVIYNPVAAGLVEEPDEYIWLWRSWSEGGDSW